MLKFISEIQNTLINSNFHKAFVNHSVSWLRLSFIILILQFSLFPAALLNAETRTVRVGVFQSAPLVFMKDDKPQGLFIDLVESFAKTFDWRVLYVEGTWKEHLISLEKGEIDLLPAIGFTSERTLIFDYSRKPVYIDSGVLFTSSRFPLHTVFNLQGKRIAAANGSVFNNGFLDYIAPFGIKCDIILKSDNRAVMQAIVDGETEAGICIYSLGNELMKELPVEITPISFSPIALHFAVPKGRNADLIAGIDKLMAIMDKDPESVYSLSFKKWTKPSVPFEFPVWFWWAIAGLLITGLFLGLWNISLNRLVAQKTKHLEVEIFEHKLAKQKIEQSLCEKEALILELYHRTQNTMQVIRGMLLLQADEFSANEELQLMVKNTERRIHAISLVHQMLYKTKDLSRISIKEYVCELSASIMQRFCVSDEEISLNIKIDDQYFLLDTAIPFGLILNELMTNSLEHAFPGGKKGMISITLTKVDPDKNILHYSDNGVGVSNDFDFHNQNTLGLKFIYNIGEQQMMGKVTMKNNNGINCLVEFTNNLYKKRV